MVTWCKKTSKFLRKIDPLLQMAPKLSVRTPFDKDEKKMCQITLNTYSHNEPYDLHAQVIFQKKAYDDNTLPITHTLF